MKKFYLFLIILLIGPIYLFAENKPSSAVVDITNMTIVDIQKAVENGYLTYEMLVRLCLERIETYDKQYNSIRMINNKAINDAKSMDLEYKLTGKRSLLHGIPVVLKDNIDYIEMPTTAGAKALSDSYPKTNADIVQKLLDAGAIIIAKTNMSEFAFSAANSFSSYGNVYNAYDTNFSSYGSSGGTAVAVAASFALVGIGTDTNSSIRTPASANNLIGMRPTLGTISNNGIMSYDIERDISGPITKYVEDNILVLSIINNQNKKYSISKLKDFSKIKIGVITEFFKEDSTSYIPPLQSTYKPIIKMMNDAITIFEEQGATIVNVTNYYNSHYNNIRLNTYTGYLFCYEFNKYILNTNSKIKNYDDLLKTGMFVQNLNYYNEHCNNDTRDTEFFKNKMELKKEYKNYVEKVFDDNNLDVIIYPTTKNKLLTAKESLSINVSSNSGIISPITGMPALNLPLGMDNNNPYGFEMVARDNQEELLYEIALLYEEITNLYKLPEIAKPLYIVDFKIEQLKNLYETHKNDVNYDNLTIEVENYFLNYNIENSTEKTDELINKYISFSPLIIKEESLSINWLIILLPLILIFLLIGIYLDNRKIRYFKRG